MNNTAFEMKNGTETNGDEIEKYAEYIGEKSGYYINKMKKSQKRKFLFSWNMGAFAGGGFWYVYRKMYGLGTLFIILESLIFITGKFLVLESLDSPRDAFATAVLFSVVIVAYILPLRIIAAVVANGIYLIKIRKMALECENVSYEEKQNYIKKAGGTDIGYVVKAVLIISSIMFLIAVTSVMIHIWKFKNAFAPLMK